jgi:hypothetical protein
MSSSHLFYGFPLWFYTLAPHPAMMRERVIVMLLANIATERCRWTAGVVGTSWYFLTKGDHRNALVFAASLGAAATTALAEPRVVLISLDGAMPSLVEDYL